MVALVVPDPDRGGIPLDPSQYRPLRRPARKSHCSDLPCWWRCPVVKLGSFRYLVRPRPEPPSACGISPRRAGGEGKWGLRAGLLGGSDFRSPSQLRPLRGRCPAGAEGETPRSAGVTRKPPPQSLRDSSPSGGAICNPLLNVAPRGAEGETAPHRHYSRSCGPPPQSLRDSSPSGGAMGSRIPLTALSGRRNPEGAHKEPVS